MPYANPGAVETHMDTWEDLCCVENYRKNESRGKHFVRACTVETHMDMDISEEPFCVEIYRENAGRPGDHLD